MLSAPAAPDWKTAVAESNAVFVNDPLALDFLAKLAALTGDAATNDPLADFKSGVAALDAKHYGAAITLLRPLNTRLPKLADYTAWFVASADFEAKDYGEVPKELAPVWSQTLPSPLAA